MQGLLAAVQPEEQPSERWRVEARALRLGRRRVPGPARQALRLRAKKTSSFLPRPGWRLPPEPTWPSGRAKASKGRGVDRKSTRLNSSHSQISYAVLCLKQQRHGLAEVGEDRGEAWDHERHEEHDRADADREDHHGIGERRDEGFGERGARFEELGEAPQRDLEDAALLTRPDHVDVEAGERAGGGAWGSPARRGGRPPASLAGAG